MIDNDKAIEYVLDNEIAYIYFNRPHRLNAITVEMVEQLLAVLDQAEHDDVRAVVLSGRGSAFSSGHDLQGDTEPIPEHLQRQQLKRLQNVTRRIWSLPFPVIAKVHGYALGAGCEIALGCDLILAAEDATFGFPEVGVGLSVTGGISSLLAKRIGLPKAKEILFFSKQISGAEAEKLGLINYSAPLEQVDREVEKWLVLLTKQPYNALNKAKEVLNHGFQYDMESSFQLEIEHALQSVKSEEFKAAVQKFTQKKRG